MPQDGRNEARRTLDTSISEKDLQDAVIAYMRQVGWLVAHFRPARTIEGWRTPVAADGEGFPDVIALRGNRELVIEFKSATGKPMPKQRAWMAAFEQAGVDTYLWRPSDWINGVIDEVVR